MKNRYGRELTFKWIGKIIAITLLYTLAFIGIFLLARSVCGLYIWQATSRLYQFLHLFDNIYFVLFVWLLGFFVIVVISLFQILSYVDAMAMASELLVLEDEQNIKLPEDLVYVEKKMNEIKENARHQAKVARDQEQRKNDLVVYLAHDIKTPLTMIIGYLSLLDEIKDMDESRREKYIKVALEKSYRLEELMNELFDITRFNSEKIILEKEPINLNLMLAQIVDDFYPTLQELGKEIVIKKEDKVVLEGDSNRLARVFNNVIKNALYYSVVDEKITIKLTRENGLALVEICNKGKTIPEEKLARIFEKFYRVDQARGSKNGGSGLGLAIAKEIVELHGGKIWALSEKGWTRFFIQLPCEEENS